MKKTTVIVLVVLAVAIVIAAIAFSGWIEKKPEEEGNILAVKSFKEGDTEFTGVLSRLKEKNPDAVVLIGYVKEDVVMFIHS